MRLVADGSSSTNPAPIPSSPSHSLIPSTQQLSLAEAAGLQAELNELNQQETALKEAEERHFWSRLLQHELKAQADDHEVKRKKKQKTNIKGQQLTELLSPPFFFPF